MLILLKQLYYSFIYSYLTYGVTSWGGACKTRLQKIKTINVCVAYSLLIT